ncbi:ABC transporter family substrate-binding protein [uncultured Bifidobacterium sp.]|uniref:ABC transporter family substrate-binding protein n=1 Tax=uncultured Bifidobacterium sp. TaxID=165187 RepID=UPI0028DCAAC6|nr:ABC transporter family substrate-binding protein [uncultured Bifidobacterium sp.]
MTARQGRLVAAVAIMAAVGMLVSACGGSSNAGTTTYKELSSGIPASYKGALPTPVATKGYYNEQQRSNVKDGGTLNLAISEIGPNWNLLSSDGNTTYMNTLWSWYQPSLITTGNDVTGKTLSVNKDYLTDMKLVSKNPMVVQYDINPKATWNDGSAIDWTAFKATWVACNGKDTDYNPPSTDGFDRIASVKEGSNAKQVIVTYSTPYYPWQLVFTNLVNPKAGNAKTFTSGWTNNPHNEWAAGPYIVSSFSDSQVTFTPNPKWWGDKPKLDKVVYKLMTTTAELNAFENGEIDADSDVTTSDQVKTVRSVSDAVLRFGYSTDTDVINYNGKSAPLNDVKVRKALTQAFDVSTYNKIHYKGLGWNAPQPGSELLAPFQKGYENNRPSSGDYSVANAKKTLESDGYKLGSDGYYAKGGKDLQVSYTYFGTNATQQALAEAYQAMMKKAGIKVKVVNKSESKFSDTVTGGDYEVLPMAWEANSAYGFISSAPQLYTSDGPSNFTYVGTKKIDALLKKAGNYSEYDDQVKATNTAEKAALKLFGTIPVSTPASFVATKKGLANYGVSGFATIRPEDIGWQK